MDEKEKAPEYRKQTVFWGFFAFYFPFSLNSCIVEISNRERNDVL